MFEEDFAHFSKDISDEIKKYAENEVLLKSRYIFFKTKGKHRLGYCTHCHTEFQMDELRYSNKVKCPNCGSKCIAKSEGIGRGKLLDDAYFVYYEKSLINPNVMIARGIYVCRNYRQNYRNVKTEYSVWSWYVFQMGNSFMIQKSNRWYWKNRDIPEYEKVKVRTHYDDSTFSGFANIQLCYSRKSIRKAVSKTPFKYSMWTAYDHQDMTRFFDMYSRWPGIEYLAKEGFKNLITDKLNRNHTYHSINWRGKTIFMMLKLTRAELKEIKVQNAKIDFEFLNTFHDVKKQKWNLNISEVIYIASQLRYRYKELIGISKYLGMKKFIKYIKKQYKDFNRVPGDNISFWERTHYYSESSVIATYEDYIKDCEKLNMNLSDEHVLFPKNLYQAHQNTIKAIEIKQNEKYDLMIKNRIKALKKYSFTSESLMIRAAQSSLELIEEGQKLHHCVATYIPRYAEGETNIMVIRKLSEPEKPYVTLEFIGKEVRQCYGNHDTIPGKDVQEFVTEFKKQKLAKKKNNKKMRLSA